MYLDYNILYRYLFVFLECYGDLQVLHVLTHAFPTRRSSDLRVEQASAQWLRHTAGSNMANNSVDLRHGRDNLGHESISTTNTYLHSSDDARHRETEKHHKIGW